MMTATVYMIPTVLADQQTQCLPSYLLDAVKQCSVFFVENERTARRYLKLLWKDMVIDDYQWLNMKEPAADMVAAFRKFISEGRTIGVISEAGCPGIADPGQQLAALAQQMKANVRPLVGPSSILLALMASGMNGQQFQFTGYLPIESSERVKAIRTLESESRNRNSTQIFIETPYRNNQLMESLVKTLHPDTRVCVAVDLTAPAESVKTMAVKDWRKEPIELHKRPAIFLLYAGT
jgi:16S rRNA (cytidine1402-2'-O)-methyltransferase